MRNWSLSKKILLSGLIFVTAVIVVSAAGISSLVHLTRANESFSEKYNIELNISPLENSARKISLLEMQSITEPSEDKASLIPKQISDAFNEWETAASKLAQVLPNPQQKSRLSELRSLIVKRKELSDQILKSALDGETEEAFALLSSDEITVRGLNENIQKISAEIIQTERSAALQHARDSSTQGRLWIYWLTLLAAAALAFALLLMQTLVASLRKNFNRTGEGLFESVDELVSTAHSATQDGNKLSEKTGTHAAALEEMSTTVAQMISAVNTTADRAKLFAEFAEEVSSHAARGQAVGDRLERTAAVIAGNTGDILKHSDNSKRQLADFSQILTELSEKSKAMTEFAFKTRLMSFNASLEASRAGENGRGFSLIADELAELAETSGAAAKEFNAILHGRLNQASSIIGQSCSVLQEIANRSSQAENETNSTVLDCNKALRELMEDSLRMARFAQELRQASEAQALGFTELGRTICELEEMSRQNADASDTFAASADELAVRIINHKALLKNLSLMMTGQQVSTSRLEQQAKNEEELPDQSSTGDGLQTDKSRLLTFRGKNLKKEKKTTRTQRFGQRARSEEFMRKAAGAEDIPFEKE